MIAAPLLDEDLNRLKRHLLFRSVQTWQEWVELAGRYKERGSIGNYAGCLWQARQRGAPVEQTWLDLAPAPVVVEDVAEEEKDWTDV